MFWSKPKNNDLKTRTVQIEMKLSPETEARAKLLEQEQEPAKPTGPIAELCRDIVAHPGEYRLAPGCIVHKTDGSLTVHCRGYPDAIVALFEGAWEAVGEIQDRETEQVVRAHLAKVRAEREKMDRELSPVKLNEAIQIIHAHGNFGRHIRTLAAAVELLRPVLEGTLRIVAVDPEPEQWGAHLDPKDIALATACCKRSDVTIETHTPGDDRPVMRDFMTEGTLVEGKHRSMSKPPSSAPCPPAPKGQKTAWPDDDPPPTGRKLWPDLDGNQHTTRDCMRAANIEIKRRRAKNGPPAPPPEPPMKKGA